MRVECTSCRNERRCPDAPQRHRRTLFAWTRGASIEDCRFYAPRLCRGVEGVLEIAEVRL